MGEGAIHQIEKTNDSKHKKLLNLISNQKNAN